MSEPTIDLSVAGEADLWMTYCRHSADGYPLSIFVRMNNPHIQSLANAGIITRLRFDSPFEQIRDDGMPSDVGALQDLEERFLSELQMLDVGVLHMSSVTGDGGRSVHLIHENQIDFDPLVSIINAPDVQISASMISDRNVLIDLISPTPVEQQLNGDMRVISSLESNGDDGTVARRTDFWFYGERANLEKLVAEITPWGYAVDRWLDEPEGVVIFTEMSVDIVSFSEVTPVLVGAAGKHCVTYDGWETFVVRPGATESEPVLAVDPKPKSILSRLFGAKKN